MELFVPFLGKPVEIEVAGYRKMTGVLIEFGPDYLVVLKESKYFYLALSHVLQLSPGVDLEPAITDHPPKRRSDKNTYRKLLTLAKTHMIELYACDHQPLIGRLLDMKDDYIILDTIRHRTSFIPIFHIKWFSPSGTIGFEFDEAEASADVGSYPDIWAKLIESHAGRIIVLDYGLRPGQTGYLKEARPGWIEFVPPGQPSHIWNSDHIRSLHLPGR